MHALELLVPRSDAQANQWDLPPGRIASVVNRTYGPGPDNLFRVKRSALAFMAGGVRLEDAVYSGGVRQALWNLYGNGSDPDIRIYNGGAPDYEHQLRTSKFCIAPAGTCADPARALGAHA